MRSQQPLPWGEEGGGDGGGWEEGGQCSCQAAPEQEEADSAQHLHSCICPTEWRGYITFDCCFFISIKVKLRQSEKDGRWSSFSNYPCFPFNQVLVHGFWAIPSRYTVLPSVLVPSTHVLYYVHIIHSVSSKIFKLTELNCLTEKYRQQSRPGVVFPNYASFLGEVRAKCLLFFLLRLLLLLLGQPSNECQSFLHLERYKY